MNGGLSWDLDSSAQSLRIASSWDQRAEMLISAAIPASQTAAGTPGAGCHHRQIGVHRAGTADRNRICPTHIALSESHSIVIIGCDPYVVALHRVVAAVTPRPGVPNSGPSKVASGKRGQVAQVVERSPEKAGVGGSTPSLVTIIPKNLAEIRRPEIRKITHGRSPTTG